MHGTTNGSKSVATTQQRTPARRWDPFSRLAELESEFDRLFGERLPDFLPLRRYTGPIGEGWAPSADVFERDGNLVVKAELPGVDREHIDVSVEKGSLVIKGERKSEDEVKEDGFYRMERFTGSFHRRFTLPEGIDEDAITAEYKDGVLEIDVPKPSGDEEQPDVKRISVS